MATVNKDFRVKHGLVVEGSTATVNGSNVLTEASTEFLQDTTAAMLTNGAQSGITFTYNDSTGVIDAAVSTTPTFADKIIFEGATADDYETTLQVVDPTADRTITLPDATTTLVGKDTTDTFTNKTFNTAGTGNTFQINGNTVSSYVGSGANVVLSSSPTISNLAVSGSFTLTNSGITFEGATDDDYETTLQVVDPTADRTITLPNVTGTVITTGDTGTVTNTMLAGSIANNKLSNSSITINGYEISLGGSATYGTDNISEGTTNKYFTDERAQDAAASMITNGTHTNLSVSYNDNDNTLNFTATGGVGSLAGTANEVEVTNVGTAYTVGLPDNVTLAGNLTINGTPTSANHAATVAYVDAATAGLNVHDAVQAATTTNINLATDLENGDTLDTNVTLATGMRVLVKNQTNKTQNGIYIVQASGAAVRASDYNEAGEVDAGDFVFVEAGFVNGKTGWVQTNKITTLGSDNIEFTQFSGAGTYQEGTGIDLNGNVFSIDTTVTVDKDSIQTLTNKTLTSPTITSPSISGLYLSDNNIVIEGDPDTYETTLTFTNPTADRTITFKDESGTVAYTGDITSAINALSTTDIEEGTNLYYTDERAQDAIGLALGTGLSYNDTTGAISNSGVLSITGTSNQISADASTGAVTLSLPQSIHTGATPTFSGLTLGSLTLTDALIGTATQSLTDGTATVIDTWSASSYNSAKYVVQMKKGTDIEVIEVLVTIDGNNNVYLTEYADVISNTQLGTTDADYSSGNVRLLVTASVVPS